MEKIKAWFNFDNIGTKIKNYAKWYCWISIIVVWIAAVILVFGALVNGSGEAASMLLCALVGSVLLPFSIWISCWMMYAFGELVEAVTRGNGQVVGASGQQVVNTEEMRSTPVEPQKPISQRSVEDRAKHLRSQYLKGIISKEEYEDSLKKEL